jgi:hypothetical protein
MNARVSKWLVVIPVCLALILPLGHKVLASDARAKNVDPEMEIQILHASLQIQMFELTKAGDQYLIAKGLATLVLNGGEMQIVTHNHWGEIMKNAEFVRFYDASDNLLADVNVEAFNQSILEQDAGTLLLKAPKELIARKQVLRFANLGLSEQVRVGDTVLLVQKENNESDKLALTKAIVEGLTTYKKRPAFTLFTLDGQPIIPGDSGGGVWLNGRLVGNIWGRETVNRTEGWRHTGWLRQAPEVKEVGYVAELPQALNFGR